MTINQSKWQQLVKLYVWAVRLGVGGALIYSGGLKVLAPYEFLIAIQRYNLVGPDLALFSAAAIPWVELVLGASVLSGVLMEGALLSAVLLMMVFSFATASALWRRLPISCACFGSAGNNGELVGYVTVLRSLGIAALCAFALLMRKGAPRIATESNPPASSGKLSAMLPSEPQLA